MQPWVGGAAPARWTSSPFTAPCFRTARPRPLALDQIRKIRIRTTLNGDNWNIDSITVDYRRRDGSWRELWTEASVPLARLTSSYRTWVGNVDCPIGASPAAGATPTVPDPVMAPPGITPIVTPGGFVGTPGITPMIPIVPAIPPQDPNPVLPESTTLGVRLTFTTGGDDLRGGSNAWATVLDADGRVVVGEFRLNRGENWPNNSVRPVDAHFTSRVVVSALQRIRVRTDFGGGLGGDNWDIGGITGWYVDARGAWHQFIELTGTPLVRLTGDRRSWTST